ncbi:MAG: hypothetical protein Q3M30_06535 [Candidatus Electrothrix sp. Rat3]|nr:hypothetical protein [Candidatus Electrothrix rattekaaiensis]
MRGDAVEVFPATSRLGCCRGKLIANLEEAPWRKQKMIRLLFDTLTKEKVKNQAIETFTNFYLLHISVIQGVAFGLLSIKILASFGNGEGLPQFVEITRMTFSFLMIVLVSYQYAIFIGIYRRSLTVFDILIPFGIGLFEIAPGFFLNKAEAWWAVTAIFCLVATLGFINTVLMTKEIMFGGVHSAFEKTKKILYVFIGISICSCVISGLMFVTGAGIAWLESTVIIFLDVVALSMFAAGEYYLGKFQSDYGIE